MCVRERGGVGGVGYEVTLLHVPSLKPCGCVCFKGMKSKGVADGRTHNAISMSLFNFVGVGSNTVAK